MKDTRYLYTIKDCYYFQKVFKNYGGQYRVSLKTKKLEVAQFRRDEILEKWNEIEWNNTISNPAAGTEGYIYCIGNLNYEGWVKVGRTKDPDGRLKNGYNCYAPEDDFYYIIKKKVNYHKLLEKHLIKIFTKYCGQHKQKSEWFRTDECNAIKYFKEAIHTSKRYLLKIDPPVKYNSPVKSNIRSSTEDVLLNAFIVGVIDKQQQRKQINFKTIKGNLLRNLHSYANR
jgi:hypothetical protein